MKQFTFFVIAFGLVAGGCNNNAPDNVKAADTANSHKTDSMEKQTFVTDSTKGIPSKGDADFMVKAISGGMLEVQLGQLAQQNASNPGVKDFGAMMMHDHTLGGQQLRSMAVGKHIIMPDSISNDQKKERDDLGKKTGPAFDKAYVKLMISDHKEDISEFQQAAEKASDPDIRALAASMIPVLKKHLESVQNLSKSMH
jgi:putative membrane protein